MHWTLTIEHRETGWLDHRFHTKWNLVLLHCCSKYQLVVPVYVLMPDHMHILCLGLSETSDQRPAMVFLRRHLSAALAPARWQKQPHDHVLTEKERQWDAFAAVVNYLRDNPVRAQLVENAAEYPFFGCCVPGYPDWDLNRPQYLEQFWRIYHRHASAGLEGRH